MTQYSPQTVIVRDTSNTLGIVGFVSSLVGLVFTGGILCPVGLIISLIAMGRRPRGFATAGLVLGLLGTCGWMLVFVFAGAAILAALGLAVVAVALTETEKVEITSDMANMAFAIKLYEEENRYLPASLDLLALKSTTLNDPWGNRYEYRLIEEEPGFDLISRGADGVIGTDDDVRFTSLGETWDPGGFDIKVDEDDEGGRVKITLGDRSLTAQGDDAGGTVTIDLGDRVVEIVGDDEGGSVEVTRPDAEDGATQTDAESGSGPG